MDNKEELRKIKKLYGEEMMHLCRELFPTILNVPGTLIRILKKTIAPTKSLIKDIIDNNLEEEFKDYIYSFVDVEKEVVKTNKTPKELLEEVGYDLYVCNTEEDIQSFKKYYAKDEELCTFRGGRLNRCYVFFAVKKDVDSIKRENFKEPRRQDEYGTSVISIQFSRGEHNTISIKNRYNHIVNMSDATFNNNLEEIIPGLTDAFERQYGLNIVQGNNYEEFLTDPLSYVRASDGRYYRKNTEYNGINYCENNVIIDNGRLIDKYSNEKERYLVMGCYILDLKEKKILLYDNKKIDSFPDTINPFTEKIEIKKDGEFRIILIKCSGMSPIIIKLDKYNNILSYKNDAVTNINDEFLYDCSTLEDISLVNLQSAGSNCFAFCSNLKEMIFPNLKFVGDNFGYSCHNIRKIYFPFLKKTGGYFLSSAKLLEEASFPKLEDAGRVFMNNCGQLKNIDFQSLISVREYFLFNCHKIIESSFPNLERGEDYFMSNCYALKKLFLPKAYEFGDHFLDNDTELNDIYIPNLRSVGYFCLSDNMSARSKVFKQIDENNSKVEGKTK